MSENSYFCQLCSGSDYHSFAALYAHINLVHGNDSPFQLRCELAPLCGSIYRTLASYKSHIYKHHRDLISSLHDKADTWMDCNESKNDYTVSDVDNQGFTPETTDNQNYDDFELLNESDKETELEFPLFTKTTLAQDEEPYNMKKFQKYYTRFLLELREQHLLSQKIVSSITSSLSVLFTIVLNIIKNNGSNPSTTAPETILIVKVEEIINQTIMMIEDSAANEYKFLKCCKEFFQYEEPHKLDFNNSGECGYIVPIKKSIQSFLNKPEIIDFLIKNRNETILTSENDKDLLLTYRDGTAAANNQSLKKNRDSFLLQLYSDEVGVTNPIGPKKDEQKLSLFYYLLDDLPPIIRSLLNSIGLIGICLSKFLNNPSHRRIFFDAMINDLNELQTKGLTLSSFTGRLYFAFDVIAADNLAANDLGGFQKNFNYGYFCRMCYISYTYKSIPLTDISFLIRSETSHENYLNQTLQSNKSVFGITRRSDYSNLIAFHPVKSLPFDIMHDFSEDEDIDGTLLMKLRFEDIKSLFPKLKQRTIFMDEREKLSSIASIKKIESNSVEANDDDNSEQPLFIDAPMESSDSIPFVEEVIIENTEVSSANSSSTSVEEEEHDDQLAENEVKLSDDYELPKLPADLRFIVDQKDFKKLGAHTHFRRVLLNIVYDDVSNKHCLLYPKAQDYLIITKAILRSLNISIDDKNALVSLRKHFTIEIEEVDVFYYQQTIEDLTSKILQEKNEYRESIKQKFKNERKPLQRTNAQVQRNKNKFGKGSGRPVKKNDMAFAERKTDKILFIGRSDDDQDMLKLSHIMKDDINKQSPDLDMIKYYWRKTFVHRRLFTRNNSTKDVLLEFPGYSLPCLIFEEIRMTMDIDVERNAELSLPALFEKVPDNSMFVSDVLAIRLIKLLYYFFKDPVIHVLMETDPTGPAPCIKMFNDKYELYLDCELIAQTTSAQQALLILLCLYNIFEIKFARHSRGTHLLYGVVFQDQNELSKSLRKLLLSWDYTIKNKPIVYQHKVTTATTTNDIDVMHNVIPPNEEDSRVHEETAYITDQQKNNLNKEAVLNSSSSNTQTLTAKENTSIILPKSEHEFMLTDKQYGTMDVDENTVQTMTTDFVTGTTTKSSQRPNKKRKAIPIHEEPACKLPPRRQCKKSRLS